ncbi:MAG: glycosyl hydrolase family 28-related protein, partial [Verrucomicrobiota bacterium]
MKRRTFISSLGAVSVVSALQLRAEDSKSIASRQMAGWAEMDALRKAVQQPSIRSKDYTVESFGAVGDRKTDCTDAIAAAIEACSEEGGGRVVFRSGVYRTGPVRMKSGVCLHIEAAAMISFFTEPERYLPPVFTRWEGIEVYSYSPLISARDAQDIAITGEGVIDGNAADATWWAMSEAGKKGFENSKQKLRSLIAENAPVSDRVFGENSNLRPV